MLGSGPPRGFLPPPLMNNRYAATFPFGSSLPTRPNPLSQTKPVSGAPASVGGIQQAMAKRALAAMPTLGGVNPQASQKIISTPSSPHTPPQLADPFHQYTPSVNAKTGITTWIPPTPPAKVPLPPPPGALQPAPHPQQPPSALGAPNPFDAPVPHVNRKSGVTTMRSVNPYPATPAKPQRGSSLQPPPLAKRALAMPTLGGVILPAKQGSDCCITRSASGEGKKRYKFDQHADAKGEEAFDSLDTYMRKLGFDSFQRAFFGRLLAAGLNEQQLREAVKRAGEQFGEKVAAELNSGIEKLAGILDKTVSAIPAAARWTFKEALPGAARRVGNWFRPVGEDLARDALKTTAVHGTGNAAARAAMQEGQQVARRTASRVAMNRGEQTGARQVGTQVAKKLPAEARTGVRLQARQSVAPNLKANLPRGTPADVAQAMGQQAMPNARMAIPRPRAYQYLNPAAQRAATETAKQTARMSRPMVGQAITGASHGALNPYTGFYDPNADNEFGINWQRGLASTATGALLGGTLSKTPIGRAVQQWQQRAIAGSFGGGGLGLGARLAGYDVDPETWARGGYMLGGVMPSAIRKHPTTNILQWADPFHVAQRGLEAGAERLGQTALVRGGREAAGRFGSGLVNRAIERPVGTLAAGTMGTGALLGGAGLWRAGNAAQGMREEVTNKANEMQKQVNERFDTLQPKVETAIDDIKTNVNNQISNYSPQNLLGNIFGGGKGGQGGQFGNVIQQLLPYLLLGGLGAGGGYALGGGSGATMGGLGLPLAYLLMQNPQWLSAIGLGGAAQGGAVPAAPPVAPTATQAAQQQQRQDDAKVRQDLARPGVAPTAPQQASPEAQQAAALEQQDANEQQAQQQMAQAQ